MKKTSNPDDKNYRTLNGATQQKLNSSNEAWLKKIKAYP